MVERPDRQRAAATVSHEFGFVRGTQQRRAQVHARHVLGRAHRAVRTAAGVRADAEDLLHLQETAVHAGAAGVGRAAPVAATARRVAGRAFLSARDGGVDLDFRVPVADAETRVPARLVHDQPEVLEPGLLLHDPAWNRLRIRRAAEPDQWLIAIAAAAPLLRGFAQPSAIPKPAAVTPSNGSAKPSRSAHPHESKRKMHVMNFSPNRAASRFREPWRALARRPSTTLSTPFVDKRKTTSGSSAYRPFLRVVATSRAN